MRFIDEAEIYVKAGHGGAGAVSFRREKFVPMGGPDGGEGGSGGNVFVEVDPNLGTLMDLRYKRKFLAENGHGGQGRLCSGKDGKDVSIRVPVGTIIRDQATGEILFDLNEPTEEPILLCKGGRGGKGNTHFKSSTHQAPKFSQPGEDGEERTLTFELKLLADVAIIGLPNAGKSSLISSISAARPKIADYPFTTLVPNLGVVRLDDYVSFVVADVPGLIEGASEGAGLGHRFLRHVERSRVLVHLVDVSMEIDPKASYETIRKELLAFDPKLGERREIIVFNKIDALQDSSLLDAFIAELEAAGKNWRKISVATREGVADLLWLVYQQLEQAKAEQKAADAFPLAH